MTVESHAKAQNFLLQSDCPQCNLSKISTVAASMRLEETSLPLRLHMKAAVPIRDCKKVLDYMLAACGLPGCLCCKRIA